jgi:hypothetical protein
MPTQQADLSHFSPCTVRKPNENLAALNLVNLTALTELTSGSADILIGLIDGPVVEDDPSIAHENLRNIDSAQSRTEARASNNACLHGTFIASMLLGRAGVSAVGICPDCILLTRSVFQNADLEDYTVPSAHPGEVASAISDCLDAGARILNLSVTFAQPSTKCERELELALGDAARRGVVVVSAAGNQGAVGSSAVTRYPWVIPVVACDSRARPLAISNLSSSIGQRGLSAPGDRISSYGPDGKPLTLSGTSFAVPFVTGAIALLWSEFPNASGAEMKFTVTKPRSGKRATIVPPVLDAWGAYQALRDIEKNGKAR